MKDIVIFGLGQNGKKAIPLLEKNYHILFIADSDKRKWGGSFGKYSIEPPEKISQFRCDVIITSLGYSSEISRQLQQMQIGGERIFFCHLWEEHALCKSEVCPVDAEKIKYTGIPLIEYDLFHVQEEESEKKKVLIFCSWYSTYTKQLIENMSRRYQDIEFSLVTNAEESEEKICAEQLRHIYCYRSMADLKTILEELPIYDAMQLLWIENEWAFFYKLIRKKTKRLNLNVGGSDFYRATKPVRDLKKNLIACADCITAETVKTVQEFAAYYGREVNDKMGLLPFGVEVLDLIQESQNQNKNVIKEKFHIPRDKIVITCGHNANETHQHLEIIAVLKKLPDKIKTEIVCVFPMTYPDGNERYMKAVERLVKEAGLDYVILKKYMDFQQMAEYALISDVMIHVQETDQLSSTMIEEMYAGSVVIAGKWLPYQTLHEAGIYFLDIEAVSDLSEVIEEVVVNIEAHREKASANKAIVWQHSSWDALAPKWHALWEEKTKG